MFKLLFGIFLKIIENYWILSETEMNNLKNFLLKN